MPNVFLKDFFKLSFYPLHTYLKLLNNYIKLVFEKYKWPELQIRSDSWSP